MQAQQQQQPMSQQQPKPMSQQQPQQSVPQQTSQGPRPQPQAGSSVGQKKVVPAMSPTTNFQTSCAKTPASSGKDKLIIPWDHSKKNYVYGPETDFDFKGKLTKNQLSTVRLFFHILEYLVE